MDNTRLTKLIKIDEDNLAKDFKNPIQEYIEAQQKRTNNNLDGAKPYFKKIENDIENG